ncbi:MAG: serine hydrolase, partial [Chitinophagales bacterium]
MKNFLACILMTFSALVPLLSQNLFEQGANKADQELLNIEPNYEEKALLIKVQRLLRANSALKKFSGAVIWAREGRPLYLYTTKYANLDYKVMSALSTKFNTCSISETFTAIAIMQLAEKNKLSVDKP